MAHGGSSPAPFDGVNPSRLAGPKDSHPLEELTPRALLRTSSGKVDGEFALDHPPTVGTGLTGTLRLRAIEGLRARGAMLRLVGLRLVEERESRTERRGENDWVTDNWVEAKGELFVEEAFLEPRIPVDLQPGQAFESPIMVPLPALGPPSAQMLGAIVAWALEVRWDVAHAGDAFVAHLLPVAQSAALIRAGVGDQGGIALLDSVDAGDGATIGIRTPLPAPAGGTLVVRPHWPDVPDGRELRVFLVQHSEAANGGSRVVAAAAASIDGVRAGTADVSLRIPADAAPSFDGAGLACRYTVRVFVDRPLRRDVSIERLVSIT